MTQSSNRPVPSMIDFLFTFNNLLWFVFALVALSVTVLVYRLFGRDGLYALVVGALIIANIQVTKTVILFGLTATLGNVLYGTVFLATDVLTEVYGAKEARRCVWLGLVALVLVVLWMQFALWFRPGPQDLTHGALSTIFGLIPRVAAGSLVAYIVSQHHDIIAFSFWRRKTQGRLLWVRNCASTMVSQAIDTILFCFIALWGLYDVSTWLQILATTYFLKWGVAVLDTPFMYLAVRMGPGRSGKPTADPAGH